MSAISSTRRDTRVWWYEPTVGGTARTGRLTTEEQPHRTVVLIDGSAVATVPHDDFRGAWLWFRENRFHLDVDVGGRECIQISEPPRSL